MLLLVSPCLLNRAMISISISIVFLLSPKPSVPQFVGQNPFTHFEDTTMLHPPDGANVAILTWEDMECPACAHWYPFELAAAAKYHVAFVWHDFPLARHRWGFKAAVSARFLQDHVNLDTAKVYRGDIFAAQVQIGNEEDLQRFNRIWFTKHSLTLPAQLDPGGTLSAEVRADVLLGAKLNLGRIPTIVVATRDKYQVLGAGLSAEDLDRVVQAAVLSVRQTK